MILEQYRAKSLIRHFAYTNDIFFNPYQGCYHDCVYCRGKSDDYYLHEGFGDRIRVKINAPELLEKYFQSKGHFSSSNTHVTLDDFFSPSNNVIPSTKQPSKFMLFIGGGVCDVYQPAEKEFELTRQLLQHAHEYNFPVTIITKSDLVLRDLDLLQKINKGSYVSVSVTITFADDEIREIFEPRSSSTQERYSALTILRKSGIHGGIYFVPVLPWIGDTEENMHSIYRMAKSSGAEYIVCGGLSLKPGKYKEDFMNTIKEHFPSLYSKYVQLYGNNNKYGYPDSSYVQKMGVIDPALKGYKMCKDYNLPYMIPRYIQQGLIEENVKWAESLYEIAHLKEYILRGSWREVSDFRKSSAIVEVLSKPLTKMSRGEIQTLPVPKIASIHILELATKGKSTYLEKLRNDVNTMV